MPTLETETRSSMGNAPSNPNVNKPQVKVVSLRNNPITPIERTPKRPLALDPRNENNKKRPRIVKTAESANNKPHHPSNSFKIHENHSNQELRTQKIIVAKPTVVHDIEETTCSQSNNNTTPATQASTSFHNESSLSSKPIHEKRVSVVADDYLFQDGVKREILIEKSPKIHDNDQITCPQQDAQSAIQTLIHLKNRCSQISIRAPANQSLIINENHLDLRAPSQSVAKNTPTAMQNSLYVANQPCLLSEQSHETQYPSAFEGYSEDPRVPKNIATTNIGGNPMNLKHDFEDKIKDTSSAVQEFSNIEDHSCRYKSSNNKHISTASKNHSRQGPRTREIFLERPIMNSIVQRDFPQGITKNTPSATQNSLTSANHSSWSCSYRPDFYSYQDPRMQNISAGRSPEENGRRHNVYPQTNTENRSFAIGNSPITANQSCSLFGNSIQEQFTGSSDQQSCTQETPVRRRNNQNFIGQRVCHESGIENRASVIGNSSKTANRSFEESFSPIAIDRDAQVIPIERFNDPNHTKQKNTDNRSTSIRNSPNEINKSQNTRANCSGSEQNLTNEFNVLFRKMDSTLSNTYTMLNHARSAFVKYGETFRKLMERTNDYRDSSMNEANTSKITEDKQY